MNYPDRTGDTPSETPSAREEHRATRRRFLSRRGGLILAAVATVALAGYAGVGVSSAAESGTAAVDDTPTATPTVTASSPSRSGPADGGATGIVGANAMSSFTLTTAAGTEVSVTENSDTRYTRNGSSIKARGVTDGASVLVLGLVDSATITASQVIVQPKGDGGAAASAAAGVIPFQQGQPSPAKSVGQIPDYTEGEGTVVSGSTAFKATKAAQAVVPGGIVDRVVQLDDGEYEVHNISINWPHHVFVTADFQVIGWN